MENTTKLKEIMKISPKAGIYAKLKLNNKKKLYLKINMKYINEI